MRKSPLAFVALTVLLTMQALVFGGGTAHAQYLQRTDRVSLETAIRNAAAELSRMFGSDAVIAVLSMEACTVGMSDYLIDNMIVTFEGAGEFSVVDRERLDLLTHGTAFPTYLEAGADSARAIGWLLGVNAIVTGVFEPHWDFYRFRVSVIDMRTAATLDLYTTYVENDIVIALLQGRLTRNHFSYRMRQATMLLNFLPGFGSFVIMGDTFGGVVQLVAGAAGLGMIFAGLESSASWHEDMLMGGVVLMGIQFVFNVVRSLSYMRHAPVVFGTALDVNGTRMSAGTGGGWFSLSHTMRF